MYLFSRIVHGFINILFSNNPVNSRNTNNNNNEFFKWEAALVWGSVMWLFYNHTSSLQSSLQASMQYLYLDSDNIKNEGHGFSIIEKIIKH